MRPSIFVGPLTDDERAHVEAGLRSSDAFTLRRSPSVLASARGERAPAIARHLGCDDQTVREAIQAFNERGVAAPRLGSHRPQIIRAAFDAVGAERLRALLHQSPRTFGKPTSLWTLDLVAEVSFEQGLTKERVSDGRVPGMVLRPAPGGRHGGAAAGRGQRPLARQPGGVLLDPRPQPPRQMARSRRPHHHLLPADHAPLAHPHRAQVGPRQTARRRARRLLSADELIDRVYAAFVCDHHPTLVIPAKAA